MRLESTIRKRVARQIEPLAQRRALRTGGGPKAIDVDTVVAADRARGG
jgi:hypothetical protein